MSKPKSNLTIRIEELEKEKVDYQNAKRWLESKKESKQFDEIAKEISQNNIIDNMIYEELRQEVAESLKSINATIVVATGAIAVGKTTALLEIKDFFEKQGIQVFLFQEIALKSAELLKLIYSAKENMFAFQLFILQEFQKNLLKLKILELEGKINEETIILFDRAAPDTIIFELNNIQDEQQMRILREIRRDLSNNLINYYDHVLYFKPTMGEMLKRFIARKRIA